MTTHSPNHTTSTLLTTLLALCLCSACQPFERAVTPTLTPSTTHPCTPQNGPHALFAQTPSPHHAIATCGDTTSLLTFNPSQPDQSTFTPLKTSPITATLPRANPTQGLIVATLDGHIGRTSPDLTQPISLSPLPPQTTPPNKLTPYSYRPPGLESVPDTAITGLFRGSDDRIIALSAAAGAWVSEDDGSSWSPFAFTPRLAMLNGSRPIHIHDLIISPQGLILFLHYPEGREIAREQLPKLHAQGHETTEKGGGPLLITGQLEHQKLTARATPLGRDTRLFRAPSASGDRLWMMVSHPARHETTRFISNDWGSEWLDIGYFNFTILSHLGSPERVLFVADDDTSQRILWLAPDNQLNRYALLPQPTQNTNTTPPIIALPNSNTPLFLLTSNGTQLSVFNLQTLSADVRLLWYYAPLGLLLLLICAGILWRWRTNRAAHATPPASNPHA